MIVRNRLHPIAAALLLCALSCSDTSGPAEPPPGGGNDTTPPAQSVGPALAYPVAGGAAILTWNAPADDRGAVARYEIRYGYSFPLDWGLALRASDPPQPSPPGGDETWSLPSPQRGRELYAAVRSYDAAGNASPISDIAHVHVTGFRLSAVCTDLMTGAPVESLATTITSNRVYASVTDASGTVAQDDLSGGTLNVAVRSGTAPVLYHNINDAFLLADDADLFYRMIPYQTSPSPLIDNVLGFLEEAATGLGTGTVLRKWRALPVDVAIDTFTNNGVDFTMHARDALARWEERTGLDLFREVPALTGDGIEVHFLPRSVMGIQNGVTVHFDDAEGYPQKDIIRILDEFTNEPQLYRVMLHEFGHTIRLNHLPAGFIMFAGQPLPNDITDDEVLVVQLHTILPNGIDLGVYDVAAPAP